MPTVTASEVSGTSDGYVSCASAVWATARSGGGSMSTNQGTSIALSQVSVDLSSGGVYAIGRTFVSFPAFALPVGAVVTAGTITIPPYLPALNSPTSSAKVVVWTKTGATADLASSAFSEVGVDASAPFTMLSVIAAGSSGLAVPLTAAGLANVKTSGTDPTRFALQADLDYTDTPPGAPTITHDNDLFTLIAPTQSYVLTITYTTTPPPVFSAGSQLFYDFQRQIWFSAAYGSLQMMATDPTQGAPKIYGLTADGSLIQMLNEEVPGWASSAPNTGLGFLQTMPLNLGNMTSQKTFHGFVMVVNDVTAVTAGGSVTTPWKAFLYVDNANQSTPPITVNLAVNAQPYNTMPFGAIEGGSAVNNSVGELIGYFQNPDGSPAQGHNAYLEIYYPTGTPVNTPTSGVGAGGALNLPWAVYRMDFFISPMSESEVEP